MLTQKQMFLEPNHREYIQTTLKFNEILDVNQDNADEHCSKQPYCFSGEETL